MTDFMNTNEQQLRTLSDFEQALLTRLMTQEFPERDGLQTLLQDVLVRTIDEYGSLELQSGASGNIQSKPVPVEAEAPDQDGTMIHVLLHIAHGRPNELEFYKDDGSPILEMPPPSAFKVIVLPPAPWEAS